MATDDQDRVTQAHNGTASVASAGEPHGFADPSEAEARSDQAPSAEELDERQQNIRLQRKAMGPIADVAETIPEQVDQDEE
jgi:hypothetical protein